MLLIELILDWMLLWFSIRLVILVIKIRKDLKMFINVVRECKFFLCEERLDRMLICIE